NSCKTIRVVSPKGREFEFDFEAYVLDRTKLEQGMAKKAVDLGGTIELGSAADLIEHDGELLVGTNGNDCVKAKVVIAADGFPSTVAKSAGILTNDYMTPDNIAINYEYLMSELGVDQSVTEMYFGTKFA